MRKFKLFHVADDDSQPDMLVDAIHDERGYRRLRRALARQYDVAWLDADIQIVDVDLAGDRRLIVQHNVLNRIPLDEIQRPPHPPAPRRSVGLRGDDEGSRHANR